MRDVVIHPQAYVASATLVRFFYVYLSISVRLSTTSSGSGGDAWVK